MKNQVNIERLYAMLNYIASKEERTEDDQMYIDTLIQVLKDTEGAKPEEFNRFF